MLDVQTVLLQQELNRLQVCTCPRHFFPQEASKKPLQTTGRGACKSKTVKCRHHHPG